MKSICRLAFELILLGLPTFASAQGAQAPTWGQTVDFVSA